MEGFVLISERETDSGRLTAETTPAVLPETFVFRTSRYFILTDTEKV